MYFNFMHVYVYIVIRQVALILTISAIRAVLSGYMHSLLVVHSELLFNPFKPEFTIVIFIYYKPRIAVAILDL